MTRDMSEVGDSVDRLSPPPNFPALEVLLLLLLLAGEDEESLLEEEAGRLLFL